MKTAVVILNWNGKKLLEQFLPSVWKHTHREAEIVIADNGSNDDSINFIKENYPQIRIIAMDMNYGFPEGYNKALKQVDAQYYVLLNSDVEVTPDWLSPIVEMMDANPDIAVCQPKLLSYLDKTSFEYAGAAGGFIDKLGYPFCRGRLFATLEKDYGQYDSVCDIFWATGAAMFVRADLYHQYGGLDGSFFAHMEEVDFCWRMKNLGYRVVCNPASVCYHLGGATLPKSSAKKTFLNFRNNALLLYKNLSHQEFRKIYLTRRVLDTLAAVMFLMTGRIQDFKAVFKAHREFKTMIASGNYTSSAPHHKRAPEMYNKSIVSEYYIKGVKTFCRLPKDKFSH